MAVKIPLSTGAITFAEQIDSASDTIDARIEVSQSGVVLGRSSTGAGPHEEILFGDLPGGGSASIIDITYADMGTALSGATLTKGQFYRITDASGTDLGFVCQAIQDNEITVNGTGGYLNADFQAVGDYSGTPETFGTQLGIWRTGFEAIEIAYENLSGGTFAVGDTITGGTTGATAVIVTDDGASSMTAYMTSAGVAFDGSEVLDNGAGVTADQDGAATGPTIVLGDVVIWNLLHYQLTDDTLLSGDNPEDNTDAYTLLEKTETDVGYITAWGISEYDFPNDWIARRADGRGNDQLLPYEVEQELIGNGVMVSSLFQWGRDGVIGNVVNGGEMDIKNVVGVCQYNTLFPGAKINEIATGVDTIIEDNILENGAKLTNITAGANCSISRNKVGQRATIGGEDGIRMGESCSLDSNEITEGSRISDIDMEFVSIIQGNYLDGSINGVTIRNVEISGNYIYSSGGISSIIFSAENEVDPGVISGNFFYGADISDCLMGDLVIISGNHFFKSLSNKEFGYESRIEDCIFNTEASETETVTENIEGKVTQPGFSDIPANIEIDGVTTIDVTAAWAQYRGIINITSPNSTEEIDQIDNPPTLFPFTLRPAAGLTLTVTGTAYSGISAGQIALKAADYVLDGDKGEYIVLEIDPLGTGCLVEKYVVNGLV